MADTFDSYANNPSSVPAKVRSVIAAMPKAGSATVGPTLNDAAFRALLDVIATLG